MTATIYNPALYINVLKYGKQVGDDSPSGLAARRSQPLAFSGQTKTAGDKGRQPFRSHEKSVCCVVNAQS
jgi:hypothetical protein